MENSIGFIIGIIGSIASIVSIPMAIYQGLELARIKKEKRRKIWTQINIAKSVLRRLEQGSIERTYQAASDMYRFLLQEAVLLEEKYEFETIKKWKTVGKISSEWQEFHALSLLNTAEMPDDGKALEEIKQFATYDEAEFARKDKKRGPNEE